MNNLWNIHGNVYDLFEFKSRHPGGEAILDACRGEEDLTPAFESNHAMADMDRINNIIKKYKVGETQSSKYSFKSDGFYSTVKNRVREYFGINKGTNGSNLISHKVNAWWGFKVCTQTLLWMSSIYMTTSDSTMIQCIGGFITGHLWIQIGFNVMHDASHYAISKDSGVNEFLSYIWNNISHWDEWLWMRHHVIRHHSHTGEISKDPDMVHFKPFIQKSVEDRSDRYISVLKRYPLINSVLIPTLTPGMFLGQGVEYHLIWKIKGWMWGMNIGNNNSTFISRFIKIILKCIIPYWAYHNNVLIALFFYYFACNLTYAVCILPDHDTMETELNNMHVHKLNKNKTIDWGEMQVRHSGNFATSNPYIGEAFGGINYQIEHHLFPTVSHIHYPKIQSIVKQTCQEFGIKYIDHPTVISACKSTLLNYKKTASITVKK